MRDNVERILNVGGALAPLLWTITFISSGFFHPEYSHYSQFISELGERGSSTEALMRYGGFYLPGLMLAGFGLLLLTKFSDSKVAIVAALFVILSAIARFAAGVFPCDPSCLPINPSFSQKMHSLSGGLAAFFLAGSGCLWFFSSRKLLEAPWFGWYSLLSAIIGIVFMFLASATAATREGVGLFQRIYLGVLHLWVLMLALAVWRSSRSFSANPSLHRIADKPGSR
jgi:hypothetical membrane protein